MKKTYLYLLVFVALAAILFFFLQQNNEKSTLTSKESDFAVEDTDEIGKIFLANRSGETATLVRQEDNSWHYNGQHLVRKQAIENLLKTLRDVRVRYVVPEAAMPLAITEMGTDGIKVELYNRKEEKMKVYYVGGGTSDNQGTYMMMEGADQPYVTHIPLWEGILTPRYLVREEDWRDRAIFRENHENIQSVSFDYPRQRSFSFKVEKEGSQYAVKPFYPTTTPTTKPINQGKTQNFLIGFTELIAEAFENKNPYKQKILTEESPFVIITITRTDGTTREVTLYPIDETFSGNHPNAEDGIEKYFVLAKEGEVEDFMLGQQRVLRRVLWAYDFFFDE